MLVRPGLPKQVKPVARGRPGVDAGAESTGERFLPPLCDSHLPVIATYHDSLTGFGPLRLRDLSNTELDTGSARSQSRPVICRAIVGWVCVPVPK